MTQVAYRLVRRPPADARRELTGEQRRVVEHSGGPLLVLGGAGTGKTFTLVESAARRLEAGAQSVAVVVHAAAAAARLREALAARVPGLAGRVRAVTWAGLAVAAVADAAGRPEVVGAAEAGRKLAELARGQAPGSWPEPWESLRHLPRFAREAGRALDWLRREGVGPELVVAAGEAQTRPEWAALGRLGREYDEVLALEGRTDFGGLFGLAAAAGAGPGVAAEAWFVDSFEEAEPAHLRLLAALAGPGANVVAFADPRQVTGQFRGASPRVAAQFADLFPGAGVAQLTRSWRQGGELAAATAAVAGRIGVAAPDVTAGGEPGTATAVVLTGQAGEAAWIAAELRRAHLAGLAWEQMAVIVRAGHRVPALAEALTAQGVPVAAGWTDVPLADEPVVADLVALAGSEEPRPGDRRSVAERLWAVWQASDWPQRLAEGLAGPARDRLVAGVTWTRPAPCSPAPKPSPNWPA
jgi:superfamily I DNA/RNA helicase